MSRCEMPKFFSQLPQTLAELQHRIRSPLSVIAGLIEDLRDQRTLCQEDIADAGVALEKLLSLIEQLSLPAITVVEPGGFDREISLHTLQQSLHAAFPSLQCLETHSKFRMTVSSVPLLRCLLELLWSNSPSPLTISLREARTSSNGASSATSNGACFLEGLPALKKLVVKTLCEHLQISLIEISESELGLEFSST